MGVNDQVWVTEKSRPIIVGKSWHRVCCGQDWSGCKSCKRLVYARGFHDLCDLQSAVDLAAIWSIRLQQPGGFLHTLHVSSGSVEYRWFYFLNQFHKNKDSICPIMVEDSTTFVTFVPPLRLHYGLKQSKNDACGYLLTCATSSTMLCFMLLFLILLYYAPICSTPHCSQAYAHLWVQR